MKNFEFQNLFKNIVFLNLIPIFINLLFMPFWFINNISLSTSLTLIELIMCLLLIPIYLILNNLFYSIKKNKKMFLDKVLLMLLSAECCTMIHYLNWGLSTGGLLNPDLETVMILTFEAVISGAFVIIGGITVQIFLLVRSTSKINN